MAWDDVLSGHQSYKDWIQARDIGRQVGQQIATVHAETQTALASVARVGLGAVENLGRDLQATLERVGIEISDVGDGIAALRADFNLHLTELIWQAQQQNEKLDRLLYASEHPETIRAREKRNRARFAHSNGLWEDAERNYKEALRLNEFDFTVYRSLGDLHLLHFQDPKTAFGYYADAARYAGAHSVAIAAENLYMAGTAAAIQQKREDALRLFEKALEILPAFGDAAFQAACLASLLQQPDKLLAHLEHAVSIDGRYVARARESTIFDTFRSLVAHQLDKVEDHEREMTRAISTKLSAETDRADSLAFNIDTRPIREWTQAILTGVGDQLVPELRQSRREALIREQRLYGDIREAAVKQRAYHSKELQRLSKEQTNESSKADAPVRQAQGVLAEFRNQNKTGPRVGLGCIGYVVLSISVFLSEWLFGESLDIPERSQFPLIAATTVVLTGLVLAGVVRAYSLSVQRTEKQLIKALVEAGRVRKETVARVVENCSDQIATHDKAIRRLDSILARYTEVRLTSSKDVPATQLHRM